jgi:hypothetical protein
VGLSRKISGGDGGKRTDVRDIYEAWRSIHWAGVYLCGQHREAPHASTVDITVHAW